eukprot:1334155-Amorphochlora_amoeboformis.AAC.1
MGWRASHGRQSSPELTKKTRSPDYPAHAPSLTAPSPSADRSQMLHDIQDCILGSIAPLKTQQRAKLL